MNRTSKFMSVFVLAALLALTFSTPAYAFDGRGGDRVIIESGDVINDDLYVGAKEFVLDGTVNGDLIVFAQTVTINGKVDGDLMAAAQSVAVNGEVTGSLPAAPTKIIPLSCPSWITWCRIVLSPSPPRLKLMTVAPALIAATTPLATSKVVVPGDRP